MRPRQLVVCLVLAVAAAAPTAVEARVDSKRAPATGYTRGDVSGTITAGGPPVTVTIPTANENAYITFSGTANQRISLNITNVSIWFTYVSIRKPDGSDLVSWTAVFTSGKFIDTQTLPTTGTYTIVIDPWSTYTGSMTLTLYDVPPDAAGPIFPSDDNVVDVSLVTPGQNGGFTFEGDEEERVSLLVDANTINPAVVRILKPDGSVLASTGAIGPAGGYLDAVTLPVDGSYSVSVDPQDAATGGLTLTLYDVPSDIISQTGLGGRPAHLAVAVPGHNPTTAFSGTAAQSVVATIGSGLNFSTLILKKPDGTTLVSASVGASGGSIGPVTLPTTGEYTFVVDPLVQNVGAVTGDVALEGAPQNTAAPSVSGEAAFGQTLTASNGTWTGSGGSFTYQWQHCDEQHICLDIPEATAAQYTVTEEEADGTLRAIVQTSNASGLRTVYSAPTATVTGERVAAPKATLSYYVKVTDLGTWEDLGCDLGEAVAAGTRPRRAVVILHFGRPSLIGSTQAVVHHGDVEISLATVKSVAQRFGVGYAAPGCAPASAHLIIGVGTSNAHDLGYSDPNVTFRHGRAWAAAVDDINKYFRDSAGCVECQVYAAAANDIEMNWSSATRARRWVHGFTSRTRSFYVDFGDAAGCPKDWPAEGLPASTLCNNAWSLGNVHWVASGAPRSFPFPQVYTEAVPENIVRQGDQWYVLARLSRQKGRKMYFRGALAQHQACLDEPAAPECAPAAYLRNTARRRGAS